MIYSFNKLHRRIAALLLVTISVDIFIPSLALALTGGPGQPEFSSFEPVNSSNMVNEFTGDFTYNLPVIQVPGPQGSGYSLSLSYHSGASPEEEASWVGYGWTLNPGAINRSTRGLPDDYKGDIKYWNRMPRNWTVSAGAGIGVEAFSKDNIGNLFGANANMQLRYNNYTGFGYGAGLGLNAKIGVSLGLNVSDSKKSYSAEINPTAMLNSFQKNAEENTNQSSNIEIKPKPSRMVMPAMNISLIGGSNSLFTYAESVRPTQIQELKGNSTTVTFGTEVNLGPVPVGPTVNVSGSYSYQESRSNNGTDKMSYGFMYTGDKVGNNQAITDYYVEKENPFQKRDVHLGIPFNNADNFIVTGEGIGGGFRMYHKKIGEFTPNEVKNTTGIFVAGAELNVGWTFGAGLDKIGTGKQILNVSGWKSSPLTFSKPEINQGDESVFFRFNNDLGGSWKNTNDNPTHVRLNVGSTGFSPGNIATELHTETERSGRSAYIGYHTNNEIKSPIGGITSHKAYTKRTDIEAITNRSAGHAIGEFSVFSENGQRYLYGLPLYNKNESSLLYGVQGLRSNDIESNYLAYSDKEETKMGQEIKSVPYANTFLLTEITTPDYIDRSLNGPTLDDLGGYTVFGYEKMYGFRSKNDSVNWYNWRIPYRGMLYQRNSLSDNLDDVGSVNQGEKEIAYLKYIKTKSHIACFILGNRTDGLEAANATARNSKTAKGTKALKKLDRIDLYLIDDLDLVNGEVGFKSDGTPNVKPDRKPAKTIHFQYNFNAWNGIPNSSNNSGKMTLARVWFEYNGVTKSKISPYEFKYNYPNYTTYPAIYQSSLSQDYTNLNEVPSYSPFLLDAWGSYQSNGPTRFANLQNWLDQTPDDTTFDPAAWQLKVIRLPSGGEIHVQYEQDDYTYVQDQPAHVMVRLKSFPDLNGSKFLLDIPDIGANSSEVVNLLKKYYLENPEGKKKIYFKFLYTLIGSAIPDLQKCNADYITGYADIANITPSGQDVLIELKTETNGSHTLPFQVCKDFVLTQRAGKINASGSCDPSLSGIKDRGDNKAGDMVKQLLGMAKANLFPSSICQKINPELSYFKIPFPGNKKGGGLRVKRLLTYDHGLDGKPVLYGSEYAYKLFDNNLKKWRSSGIATNEPSSIREESALVKYIPRKGQSGLSKIIAGEDKKQAEGPLGESIMPAASVGYARVLIKNIHSGQTNTGFNVKEFYTAREFPVKVLSSELETRTSLVPPVNAGLVNVNGSKVWASQGFSFILNNMHGQVKRAATYSGSYSDTQGLTNESLTSEQFYEYYEPGQLVPIQTEYGGAIVGQNPGKETDITLAHKSVVDDYIDANVEVDLSVAPLLIFGAAIYTTAMPSLTKSKTDLYTYATSKIVRYPVIIKKIRSYQNGVSQSVENLAFDQKSGQTVLTKTEDEIKGNYVTREAMASWFYPELGSKWENENKIVSLTGIGTGLKLKAENNKYLISYNGVSTACAEFFKNFRAGDLVLFNDNFICHVDKPDASTGQMNIYLANSRLPNSFPPPETTINSIRILRSGQTNQLNLKAGSTTYHYNTLPDLTASTVKFTNATTGTFEYDLDNALKNSTSATSIIELNGGSQGYSQVNLAYFKNKIPFCEEGLSIFNIRFKKVTNFNGAVTLELLSFQVKCGSNSLVTIE